MVTNITIDLLLTMMTFVTRVSNFRVVTFDFSSTVVTNITIDLLVTMMTLVTRVSSVPWLPLLSGLPWLPILPLIF